MMVPLVEERVMPLFSAEFDVGVILLSPPWNGSPPSPKTSDCRPIFFLKENKKSIVVIHEG